ncbi:MAG: hypothetical protein MJ132_09195 [Clostridia bacterium]|nr:hypothetical protein [Clostridia bacterium]
MLVERFEHKLRIVLSEHEMCDFFGKYEEIDYKNPKVRKSLNTLIDKAIPNSDFFRNTAKLLIEVHPYKGGCTIELIKSAKRTRRLYPAKLCAIHCENAEALIESAEAIIRQAPKCVENSALYKATDGYDYVLQLSRKDTERLGHQMQLSTNPILLAAIQEYEPIICKKAALTQIQNAFL